MRFTESLRDFRYYFFLSLAVFARRGQGYWTTRLDLRDAPETG